MEQLYRGTSKIAWSYIFLYLDVKLGTFNLLPKWAAFLLIYQAIDLLEEEERELSLLRPFCLLLGGWEAVQWVYFLFAGREFVLLPLTLVAQVVSLYFHFQLLTNLAGIALRYQADGQGLDARLLRLRTAQTIVITATAFLYNLLPQLLQTHLLLLATLVLPSAVLAFCLTTALFALRRCFAVDGALPH